MFPRSDVKVAMFVGPTIGGLFTDRLTWRWCFFLNIPIVIVATTGIIIFMSVHQPSNPMKSSLEQLSNLDYIGPLLFVPAIVCLLLALQFGSTTHAWLSHRVVGLFCSFGLIILSWIYTQYRLGERATVPLRIFRQRTILFASVFAFCCGAGFNILSYYIPLYFQAIKGFDATKSGIESLPFILFATVGTFIGGGLISLVGYYTPFMILGMTMFTIGTGLLTTLGIDTSSIRVTGFQILAGIGIGLSFQVGPSKIQAYV